MTIEHYTFAAALLFQYGAYQLYLYWTSRLSPVQAPNRQTLAQRRWDAQTRIWDADQGMVKHKKGSQFHKMHNDRKIKARTELLEIEREYDENI